MRGKDFLTIRDFSSEDLCQVISLGRRMKAEPTRYQNVLQGQALALVFEKPSLRTRVSFDVGMQQLGGYTVNLGASEICLGKRESLHDVAMNLARMVQAIMIRTFGHDIAVSMAEFSRVPVINGLTDFSHPCQAVADYMTILEHKGHLGGVKVAFIGDGNNVANSLMFAGARFGAHVAVATPEGYAPHPQVVDWARHEGKATGATCEVTHDPFEAVRDADVVYTDTWTSMGQEAEKAERTRAFLPYQVNQALMDAARPEAIFMHCLPAHRGEEVTDDVIDSRRSVVFDQAENRLHAQKAILFRVLLP